tara:strand:+ start:1501 stop:1908 length:408 start_codon:yes stop_codon:yes gene_type:complete
MRLLKDGTRVKEYAHKITLSVHTKCPEKYKLTDLETGQQYLGNTPDGENDFSWNRMTNSNRPNKNFDFDVNELALVESAMKYRIGRLNMRRGTVVKESSKINIDNEIKQIYTLLGKIHNQKVWYRPKDGRFQGGG